MNTERSHVYHKNTLFVVTINGVVYEGTYYEVKELREQAIRNNVGCSGIKLAK